eukprot:4106942-Prorocentrum_lima.AAC.1
MPLSKKVLDGHDCRSRPLHFFLDVLNQLPDEVRDYLKSIESAALEDYKSLQVAYKGDDLTPPSINEQTFQQLKKEQSD